jgi:hypothetical protein
MPSSEDRSRLADWAVGTYHATAFVLVLLVVLYRAGGLGTSLETLNTFLGLAFFGVLWLTTWLTTRQMLRSASPVSPLRWLGIGLVWGALNGVLFLAGVFALLFLTQLPSTGFGSVQQVAFVPIPAAIAFFVGAIVGLALAAIDLVLLEAAAGVTWWIARASRLTSKASDH